MDGQSEDRDRAEHIQAATEIFDKMRTLRDRVGFDLLWSQLREQMTLAHATLEEIHTNRDEFVILLIRMYFTPLARINPVDPPAYGDTSRRDRSWAAQQTQS